MKRPTGITIIAAIFLILGILSFLWSLIVFGVGGMGSIISSLFSTGVIVSENFWSGMLGMAAAAVQFIVGIGLLRLSSWAWYLALIGAGLTLIQGVVGMFSGGIFSFFCAGIGLIFPLIIVIYLLRPHIRTLFKVG